ncbi:M56 family metallopeptidase [Streptomyces sp. H27-D2]|uniref:M56 family metallopeptidase n=1 Tax=Streptomyces sp. H27-D2 TaxID=3046304 RepID=UPI002DB8EEDA|nr:M56 family metallopeptidase [Streptomyces sp. H27-D2]MEC4015389.1 M56 family metallopeptidase [Streptomyces sp. H27-D2]
MRIDVYVPLVLSLLLSAVSPVVGRRLAPAPAARTLAISGLVTAAATAWGLLLLAGTLAEDAPPLAEEAREHGPRIPDPVPEIIALAAIAALTVGLLRLYRALRAHRATRRALLRLCEAHPGDTELIVAASPVPRAFAVPGSPGRILVTSAMLGALDSTERRVLLDHERAHLAHRHARWAALTDLAAAVNPLLIPVRDTVAFLLERWADESAARSVGDRNVAARALARAALITHRSRDVCALGFSERAVARRVAALQTAPPPTAPLIAAAVVVLGAIPVLGAVDATSDFFDLLGLILLR